MRETREGPHHFLHDPVLMPKVRRELFSPAYWIRQMRAAGSAPGRGLVAFVRGGPKDEIWALRHYKRGGMVARFVEDAYLWTGLDATRPWRELRVLAELHAQGLPVPRPVAAHVERHGLVYHGDLITERIANAQPVAELLAAAAMPEADWVELGRTLRRFHDAALRHDDINARNLLRDGEGRFWLLDFDKAALVAHDNVWPARNLARFRRSLEKFKAALPRFYFDGVDWQALESGYGETHAG